MGRGPAPGDSFIDDDDNTNESAIEAIRAIGLTVGCNTLGDRYWPHDAVTPSADAGFLAGAWTYPTLPPAGSPTTTATPHGRAR